MSLTVMTSAIATEHCSIQKYPPVKDAQLDWSGCDLRLYYNRYLDPQRNNVAWPIYLKESDLSRANLSEFMLVGATPFNERLFIDQISPGYRNLLPSGSTNRSLRKLDQLSTMEEIDLEQATLGVGVLISGVNLQKAKFSRAIFNGAKIQYSDLSEADFSEAVINGIDFTGSNLTKAKLQELDLRHAHFAKDSAGVGVVLNQADFKNSNLNGVDLSGALLQQTKMVNTLLIGTRFNGANLQGAILNTSQLAQIEAKNANLQYANLQGAIIEDVDFSGSFLQGANLAYTTLKGVTFSGSDLSLVNFTGMQIDRYSWEQLDQKSKNIWKIVNAGERDFLLTLQTTSLPAIARQTMVGLNLQKERVEKEKDRMPGLPPVEYNPGYCLRFNSCDFGNYPNCRLTISESISSLQSQQRIDRFQQEHDPELGECVVMVIKESVPSQRWIVARYNHLNQYQQLEVSAAGHQLVQAINADPLNKSTALLAIAEAMRARFAPLLLRSYCAQQSADDLERLSMRPLPVEVEPKPLGICLYTPPLLDEVMSVPKDTELNLVEANLAGADLRLGRLKGTLLRGAWLMGADLRGANMAGADLRGANLSGANLAYVNLKGANLQHANLDGANLHAANLSQANLLHASVNNTILDATGLRSTVWVESVDEIKRVDGQWQQERKGRCDSDAVARCNLGVYQKAQRLKESEEASSDP